MLEPLHCCDTQMYWPGPIDPLAVNLLKEDMAQSRGSRDRVSRLDAGVLGQGLGLELQQLLGYFRMSHAPMVTWEKSWNLKHHETSWNTMKTNRLCPFDLPWIHGLTGVPLNCLIIRKGDRTINLRGQPRPLAQVCWCSFSKDRKLAHMLQDATPRPIWLLAPFEHPGQLFASHHRWWSAALGPHLLQSPWCLQWCLPGSHCCGTRPNSWKHPKCTNQKAASFEAPAFPPARQSLHLATSWQQRNRDEWSQMDQRLPPAARLGSLPRPASHHPQFPLQAWEHCSCYSSSFPGKGLNGSSQRPKATWKHRSLVPLQVPWPNEPEASESQLGWDQWCCPTQASSTTTCSERQPTKPVVLKHQAPKPPTRLHVWIGQLILEAATPARPSFSHWEEDADRATHPPSEP